MLDIVDFLKVVLILVGMVVLLAMLFGVGGIIL